MGAAGIAVVLVAVAAALTLTPALLALLGGRLRVRAAAVARRRPLRPPGPPGAAPAAARGARDGRGARRVGRAVPRRALHRRRRRAASRAASRPARSPTPCSTRFAGRETDPVRVVTRLPPDSPELQAWTERVEQLPQVRLASGRRPALDGRRHRRRGRPDRHPAGRRGDGAGAGAARRPAVGDALVTGSAAFLLDFNTSPGRAAAVGAACSWRRRRSCCCSS